MDKFVFRTSVESIQLTGRKAASLMELDEGLREVEGSSLYHHTHRFYRAHSFLGSADRSDFALWVGSNLREEAVAEQLGALDLRDYRTLESLREAILSILEPWKGSTSRWTRPVPPGLEFHFCRAVSLVLPAGYEAGNLEEFLRALKSVDLSCVHYHLIESQLHFHEAPREFPNDFSQWLLTAGLPQEAQRVAEVDPYQGNLEAVRRRVLEVLGDNRLRAAAHRVVDRLSRDPAGEAAVDWLKRWRKEG